MAWEDTFRSWGAAPSATEQTKMANAETAIRNAIDASPRLSGMDISIILQGSYRAKTNVRQNSDVDICVCLNSTFFTRYPAGRSKGDYGNTDGSITFAEYKILIHQALNSYFGAGNITPGNKAFDIHSNTYRVDADVVPAFAYRFYYGNGENDYIQPTGVAFDTTDGTRIINWPEQAYRNGLAKQNETGERYRKMARILKRLRYQMEDEGIPEATAIGSFVLESLVWNVSNEGFNH